MGNAAPASSSKGRGKGATHCKSKPKLILPEARPRSRKNMPKEVLSYRQFWECLGDGMGITQVQWSEYYDGAKMSIGDVVNSHLEQFDCDVSCLPKHVQQIEDIWHNNEYEFFRFRVDEVNFFDFILPMSSRYFTDEDGWTCERQPHRKLDLSDVTVGYWSAILSVLETWWKGDIHWENDRLKKNFEMKKVYGEDMGVGTSFAVLKRPTVWPTKDSENPAADIIPAFGSGPFSWKGGTIRPWWRDERYQDVEL
eukprot:gene1092-1029_t